MSRIFGILVLAGVFVSPFVFAKNPPKELKGIPPVWETSGVPEEEAPPAVFDGPQKQFVDPPYLGGSKRAVPAPGKRIVKTDGVQKPAEPFSMRRNVAVQDVPSWPSPLYSLNASNRGSGRSVEASIFSVLKGSTTSTVSAYMHRPSGSNNYASRWATSSNLSPSGGSFTSHGAFYKPVGYTDVVDPWLAGNQMTVGIRPGALYLTAMAGYRPPGQTLTNPMNILAYASDDGGFAWSPGVLVASTTSTSTHRLDKPVSDVSHYWNTLGYLYVAWLELPASGGSEVGGPNRIRVRRNWNGLAQKCRPTGGGCVTSWDPSILVHAGSPADGAHMPQIVVNPNNGNVYLFYMTSNASLEGTLRMYRSTDFGVTWPSTPITIVSSIQITANQGYLANGVLAIVSPMIKYNAAAGKIIATWHETTSGSVTNDTRLNYVTFNPDTIAVPIAPSTFETGSLAKIHPSADADDSGNVLVTYYKATPDNGGYQLYGACRTSTGAAGCSPAAISAAGEGYLWDSFLGDYRDTFYFSSDGWPRWDAAWTQLMNLGWSEVFVTGVQ